MSRAVIIGAVAASALVLGGTGTAVALFSNPAPTKDQVYIAALKERDIPIVTEEKAVQAAQVICDAIKTGVPGYMIAEAMSDDESTLDGTQALAIVSIAQDSYCPNG